MTLAPSDFRPVTDRAVLERIPEEVRDHVRVLDLSDYGIDPGQHFARGHSIHFQSWLPEGPETPELIFNHQPLTLARWPNEGFYAACFNGLLKRIQSGIAFWVMM